jgi:poly(3-hydroxybutyrate) depolymerase
MTLIRFGSFAAVCVLALATSAAAQKTETLSLQVAGKTRSVIIHVPAGIDKPPVVFFVHGAGGKGFWFQRETQADVTADREKFIAVYPSASSDGEAGTWQDMQGTSNFAFFFAVIDLLDDRHKINRKRIYMAGFSQGGFISYAAACHYSDVFAAIAPSSGHSPLTCALKRPVPVFMTFGAKEGPPSFIKDMDAWVKMNKCASTPTLISPYPTSKPTSKIGRVSYATCEQGSQVVMDSVSGMGHLWTGPTYRSQADEVWAFFKQFSLDQVTRISPNVSATSHESFSMSFSDGFVRLQGVEEASRVTVTDTRGKVIAVTTGKQSRIAFGDKPKGVYVVSVSGGSGSFSRRFANP